jgi:uncharacterized protein involved in exopolysaccharide biosynthesis
MEGQELILHSGNRITSFTLRDFAAMAFRRRRIMLLCFFGILLGAVLSALLFPSYRAQTEILVRRQRVDPGVTPDRNTAMVVTNTVTEEEINSEVELIKSEDVLRQVVLQTGLDKRPSIAGAIFGPHDPERKVAKAIDRLRSNLGVDSLPKTNVIRVTYVSPNRQLSARVLEVLDSVYLQKHKEVQRTAGQFDFFSREVDRAKAELVAAEDKLKRFPKEAGTANPSLSRDIALQKVNELNLSLAETQAAIAETQKKIDAMGQLQKTTPARMTTQVRQQDDAPVLQQMESALLQLELKRSDLASKYQPDYPPLVELDREIASTKAAINGEKPLNDVTTDQNPAYGWINSELVKDKADLRGLQAKASETEAQARNTMASARNLEVEGIEQQDLIRTAKAAEENYLLYLHKREEARISDAFDQQSILNVAIAEKATVPSLPAESPLMYGLIGTFLALTVSAGVVFAVEYFDPSFRSPSEVEAVLNLPVLAAVPDKDWAPGNNGIGSHQPLPPDMTASMPAQEA